MCIDRFGNNNGRGFTGNSSIVLMIDDEVLAEFCEQLPHSNVKNTIRLEGAPFEGEKRLDVVISGDKLPLKIRLPYSGTSVNSGSVLTLMDKKLQARVMGVICDADKDNELAVMDYPANTGLMNSVVKTNEPIMDEMVMTEKDKNKILKAAQQFAEAAKRLKEEVKEAKKAITSKK